MAADRNGWRRQPGVSPGIPPAHAPPVALAAAAVAVILGLTAGPRLTFVVFAALAAVAVGLLAESLVRGRRERAARGLYARLVDASEALPWLPDTLGKVADTAADIERRYAATAGSELCRRAIDACVDNLAQIAADRSDTPFADGPLALTLTENTTVSLLAATTDLPDPARWASPSGHPYSTLGALAAKRGATVQQVFIYRAWTGRHERALREHHRQGIRTLRVPAERLPPQLRADLAIWDGRCAARAWMADDSGGWTSEYMFSAAQVAEAMEGYRAIEAEAEVWPAGQDDGGGR